MYFHRTRDHECVDERLCELGRRPDSGGVTVRVKDEEEWCGCCGGAVMVILDDPTKIVDTLCVVGPVLELNYYGVLVDSPLADQ